MLHLWYYFFSSYDIAFVFDHMMLFYIAKQLSVYMYIWLTCVVRIWLTCVSMCLCVFFFNLNCARNSFKVCFICLKPVCKFWLNNWISWNFTLSTLIASVYISCYRRFLFEHYTRFIVFMYTFFLLFFSMYERILLLCEDECGMYLVAFLHVIHVFILNSLIKILITK